MRQPYLLVGVLLLGWCVGAGAVMAQEEPGRLPNTALGAQGTLSDKDQATVSTYVDYWVKELQGDDCERVALARSRLIDPYNQGGTESFTTFYDQTVAGKIGAALASKHVCGRMNTLIVAQKVKHPKIVDVIKAGLKEESSAVLYQAAVAAEALAKNKNVALTVKLPLVKPLVEAIKKEKSSFVLEYLYRALAEIEEPTGWEPLLSKMNERLGDIVKAGGTGIEAEFEGLKTLRDKMIAFKLAESGAGAPKLPASTVHQFLLTGIRYLDYAWNQTDKSATVTSLVDVTDSGARWMGQNAMDGKIKVPDTVKAKTPDQGKLILLDWREVLKGEPLKFTNEQITVPMPKAP